MAGVATIWAANATNRPKQVFILALMTSDPGIMQPPPALDCARVPFYAIIDDGVQFSGRTLLFVDGKEIGRVPCLAICEERKTSGVLLFHCDREWTVLGCSAHPSVSEAKDRAEHIYAGLSNRWVNANVSEEAAESYLDEVLSRCSFCGRRFDHADEIFANESETANICNACIEEFHNALRPSKLS